jgi:3-oxoacyl-[acyl-carrier protein] reductase
VCDVSDEAQVKAMMERVVGQFNTLDILVNNAGIVSTRKLTDLNVEEWDRVMAINLRGTFLCCREAFSVMAAHGGGKIVNIASVAGKRGGGLLGTAAYAASKAGVISLTKSVAREGGPSGINCNAICPAYTETDMTSSITPEQRVIVLKMMPLGRAGKPEDVAAAVCFLASDQAAFITGEIMDVDGGLMMD